MATASAKTPEAKQEHYNKMMAEVLGKSGGYCKGKGGSMHIADVEHGNLGATGIVGGNIPVAVGAALAQKMQGTDRVVVCFFGDGASNTGNFHEALNMASLWDLPVVFVVENNMYAMSVPWAKASKLPDIADARLRLRHPRRGGRRHGRAGGARRGGARPSSARARGEGPTLDRGQDLPLVRPLALRPARLPHARKRRADWKRARPDHRAARRPDGRCGWLDEAEFEQLDEAVQAKLDEAMAVRERLARARPGRAVHRRVTRR